MHHEDNSRTEPIGHELVGAGSTHVIILNDWLCDTSTWDNARTFLNREKFTYAFTDLRGYGKSLEHSGEFTLAEASQDVLKVADALNWAKFAIVGHSMSALIALHLAQQHPDRIERAVLLTPPPPQGFGVDDATLSGLRALALADDATRATQLAPQFGDRLSPMWMTFKLQRWRATSNPEAVAGYISMFARDGLPSPQTETQVPALALTGKQDAPPMRHEAVSSFLRPFCKQLRVAPLAECGHYPMQEMPPLTVALVERFLLEGVGSE